MTDRYVAVGRTLCLVRLLIGVNLNKNIFASRSDLQLYIKICRSNLQFYIKICQSGLQFYIKIVGQICSWAKGMVAPAAAC